MTIERDYAAERIARIDALLAEARRTAARIPPNGRLMTQRLCIQLDQMLNELCSPLAPPSRFASFVTRKR